MVDHAALPAGAGSRLAARLGLARAPEVTGVWSGATSTVLVWDDRLTVKVPHEDPAAVGSCLTHARVSPAVRELGVRTPRVVMVTEPGEVVPVPVVVSTYLPGGHPSRGPSSHPVWAAVGAQLALLHSATPADVPEGLRRFTQHLEVDPVALATALCRAGALGSPVVDEVVRVRDRLAPVVLPLEAPVLCHGDVHAENVVTSDGRYVGLLDLAGAGWLDPAWDFVGMPLPAVGHALAGYRHAGGTTDGLLPRIAWCRLQTALHRAGRSCAPDLSVGRALGQVSTLLAGRS